MEKRNNRENRRNHFYMTVAAVLILITVFGGVIAFAEYTKSSSAKRVVAPYESTGVLFSSNYLAAGSLNRRYIYTVGDSAAASIITVCNYAQGNQSIVYDTDIGYTLHARLVVPGGGGITAAANGDITDDEGYVASPTDYVRTVTLTYRYTDSSGLPQTYEQVLGKRGGGNVITLSCDFAGKTLAAGVASTHEYEITFSQGFDKGDGLEIEIWTELDNSYSGISDLEGVFIEFVSTGETRLDWTGMFEDGGAVSSSGTPSPLAYDGFNYVITGSGVGTIRLSWDPSKLTPSLQFSVRQISVSSSGVSDGREWLEFQVDSSVQDRYDLQFYRVTSIYSNDVDTWSEILDSVTTVFTENRVIGSGGI
ncbi:MAG: hypothetical protein J5940_00780 [Clostridia bacterium]|nr:hypothetical protein [Clostridia bacterium]